MLIHLFQGCDTTVTTALEQSCQQALSQLFHSYCYQGIRGTGSLIHFIEAIGFPKPTLEQEGEEVREGVELSVESDVPVA